MPRAPGFVVCLLLLSAVAVMETFWKKFVVFQRKRLPTLTVAGDVGDAASAQVRCWLCCTNPWHALSCLQATCYP